MVLGKIAHVHFMPEIHFSLVRLHLPGNHPKQGGLSASIGSNDGDPISPLGIQVEIPV